MLIAAEIDPNCEEIQQQLCAQPSKSTERVELRKNRLSVGCHGNFGCDVIDAAYDVISDLNYPIIDQHL